MANEIKNSNALESFKYTASPGIKPGAFRTSLHFYVELYEDRMVAESKPDSILARTGMKYSEIRDIKIKTGVAPYFIFFALLALAAAYFLKNYWICIFTPLFILRGLNYTIIFDGPGQKVLFAMSISRRRLKELKETVERYIQNAPADAAESEESEETPEENKEE